MLWLWSAIKLFLDPVTAAKVVLLSDGANDHLATRRFPEALNKYVDTDAIGQSPAAPLLFDGGKNHPEKPLTSETVYALCNSGYGLVQKPTELS